MDFGITFKGVVRPERARALVRQAENAGFTYCWFYDSHILWRESFVAIAMLMEHTTKMRFGPCVTNPNTRDWSLAASLFGSLALQSGGRFDLGVGRGDSAVRVMGKKPATLARLEEFVHVVKALVRGEEAQYEGCPAPVKFPWAEGYDMPVWVAAYGPMALGSAGRVGIAPGEAFGRHRHPGEEIIYVLEGSLEYEVEGKPPVALKAGDVLFIPARTIHAAKNVGIGNAAELATYIVEKGKPLLELVK